MIDIFLRHKYVLSANFSTFFCFLLFFYYALSVFLYSLNMLKQKNA